MYAELFLELRVASLGRCAMASGSARNGSPIVESVTKIFSAVGEFIGSLFVLGGVPLVTIGIGTVNLVFIRTNGDYTTNEQLFITGFLFLVGFAGWVFGDYFRIQEKPEKTRHRRGAKHEDT